MEPTLITTAVLLIACVGFVGWPLLRPALTDVEATVDQERRRLGDDKVRLLTELRDLELTHNTGKITDDDYEEMVGVTRRKAAAVLKELDGLEGGQHTHAAAVEPSTAATAAPVCPSCQTSVAADDVFCRKCGQKVGGKA